MKNLDTIPIEKSDILSEMEVLNTRCRKIAIKGTETEQEIKAYDLGVKNTMSMLASLINPGMKNENRLIFQKYGIQSNMARYVRLSEVLKELYGGD